MEWLSQNWIWIVFAIGIVLLMRRGGIGRGMGHGGHSHHSHGSADRTNDPDNRPRDPVSGERVNPEGAVNSTYQGRTFYFASRENRDKFEASPAQYASSAASQDEGHRHHRHGC